MFAAPRLSIRPEAQKALTLAYQIYAVLILGSMATMNIGAAVLLATLVVGTAIGTGQRATFFKWLRVERQRPSSASYLTAAAFLFSACALSLIAAHYVPIVVGTQQVQVTFTSDMAKGWYLFWPIPLAAGLRLITADQRLRVFRTWLIAFTVISAIGVAQYFTGWPRPQSIPGLEGRFHATLFMGHHLSVASVWIFPFFAALDAAIAERDPRWKRLWLAAVFLGGVTLFFTYSRMLWVAFPVALAVWILWTLPRRMAWVVLALMTVSGAFIISTEAVRGRLLNVMGIATRQDLWQANLELLHERPFTGAGWHHNLEASAWLIQQKLHSADVFAGHAHNNLLEVLGGTGAVGLVAWLTWWVVLIRVLAEVWVRGRDFSRGWGAPAFVRGLGCAWIAFQLNGLTQVNFWESKVLHTLMWTVAWLLYWAGELGQPNLTPIGAEELA